MTTFEIVLLAVLLMLVVLNLILLMRSMNANKGQQGIDVQALQHFLQTSQQQQMLSDERTERSLREQVQSTALATRQELGTNFSRLQQGLASQLTSVATLQKGQIDSFSQQLTKLSESNAQQLEQMRLALIQQSQNAREEQGNSLKLFADTLNQTLVSLTESNAQRMGEIRATLEQKIQQLQAENASKLEEMRKTVDEKLHATLEHRLGESFKLVSDRLEKVHQGLGEMQQLAIGVGDLKRVLTNVKTRGTWGEVQLEMVLEQMLTPDQYAKNVETIPGNGERVEFAIKLPARTMVRRRYGCQLTRSFRKSSTNDFWMPQTVRMQKGSLLTGKSWRGQFEVKQKRSQKNISHRH